MINRDLTDRKILELLDLPADDRPFVQFRLRDEAPMASLVGALDRTASPEHILILANALGMRFKNAKSAVPRLIALLGHPVEQVRYAIADTLGKLRAPDGGTAMLQALHSEESPSVRAMLIAGVGAAGLRGGFEELVQGLGDSSWNIRQAAAWALGELGDPRALGVLSKAALVEEDPWVLETILTAERALGSPARPTTDAEREGDGP